MSCTVSPTEPAEPIFSNNTNQHSESTEIVGYSLGFTVSRVMRLGNEDKDDAFNSDFVNELKKILSETEAAILRRFRQTEELEMWMSNREKCDSLLTTMRHKLIDAAIYEAISKDSEDFRVRFEEQKSEFANQLHLLKSRVRRECLGTDEETLANVIHSVPAANIDELEAEGTLVMSKDGEDISR